ncbi:MAG: class I SAM-dependent methyltransferase [Actinomycetota bacterium]
MIGHTANERKLYGKTWDTIHGGYFADRGVAAPLVEAVLDAASAARPDVLADLGGGTGFLLDEVSRGLDSSPVPRLVCVDPAKDQLDSCPEHMSTLECSMEDLERGMLVGPDDTLMVCMRSVLHYLGEEMLKPDLGRFRSVLRNGEHLVHQTICFWSEREQAVANLLYDRMETGKWYPTVGFLIEALEEEGFRLVDVRPAAPIPLESAELEERYGIDHEAMLGIGMALERQCAGRPSEVYHRSRNGFTAYLEYMVMTCIAV